MALPDDVATGLNVVIALQAFAGTGFTGKARAVGRRLLGCGHARQLLGSDSGGERARQLLEAHRQLHTFADFWGLDTILNALAGFCGHSAGERARQLLGTYSISNHARRLPGT
jgi:hypothetical protein